MRLENAGSLGGSGTISFRTLDRNVMIVATRWPPPTKANLSKLWPAYVCLHGCDNGGGDGDGGGGVDPGGSGVDGGLADDCGFGHGCAGRCVCFLYACLEGASSIIKN